MRLAHRCLLLCVLKSANGAKAIRKLVWRNPSIVTTSPPAYLFRGTPLCFVQQPAELCDTKRTVASMAQPKRGSVVESYQTVSVNCEKCGERLFRYKKKNGTKSNLVKCYVERICEDSGGLLANNEEGIRKEQGFLWRCPSCNTNFARSTCIHGRPALNLVGGKVRMSKK